ncbi:hypothetical protein CYQ88_04235 [Hydrogenovibrio sp. SC-1]|uniref:hypothetical protein n=1 Tax=Hydrogenovibrio sp. SC-1 TaxID=2065820 RepID=UPI000C7D2F7C|nr:hypothetical protein [Hydrogenovibrio sp. SC-1]PLA74805.1 hypothetical protein CYQ88_04235 [Hydrogenovibrio sp. SC-1]
MPTHQPKLYLLLSSLLWTPNAQSADQTISRISTGIFYSQGQSQETALSHTTSFAIPYLISIQHQRFYTAISSYWAQLRAPTLTDNTFENSAGLGDLSLAIGYNLTKDGSWRFQVKEKFATDDSEFSSGKNDTAFQLDYFSSPHPQRFMFYTLGYEWIGKVQALNMQNSLYSSIGLGQVLTSATTLSLSFDYFQSRYTELDDTFNLSLSANYAFNSSWSISGFSSYDTSNTYGIGASIVRTF